MLRMLPDIRCSSSLLACTLRKPFFEILSGFGHPVNIYIGREEFSDWISQPIEFGFVSCCLDLGKQLEFGSNTSHNFLAIILANTSEDRCYGCQYWVENITSGVRWERTLCNLEDNEFLIEIVPSSILPIRHGDEIELKSDREWICGIHLLYKTEKRDNVEDERTNPSKRLKRSEYDNN
ncbi:hypothetical protein POM88_019881 [Heracleum sosnowskyi]|uniref:Uncharacterized protein n=1 Tax=Heracleum sosnowskyi TaxID=360622 RepID=A0AAD8IAT2_9APIA|nr:hypothetical protein POM88_019881 [Heracleum sosnowskyi]